MEGVPDFCSTGFIFLARYLNILQIFRFFFSVFGIGNIQYSLANPHYLKKLLKKICGKQFSFRLHTILHYDKSQFRWDHFVAKKKSRFWVKISNFTPNRPPKAAHKLSAVFLQNCRNIPYTIYTKQVGRYISKSIVTKARFIIIMNFSKSLKMIFFCLPLEMKVTRKILFEHPICYSDIRSEVMM